MEPIGHSYVYNHIDGVMHITALDKYPIDQPGDHYSQYAICALTLNARFVSTAIGLSMCHRCATECMCMHIDAIEYPICYKCMDDIYSILWRAWVDDNQYVVLGVDSRTHTQLKIIGKQIYVYAVTRICIDKLLALWSDCDNSPSVRCVICKRRDQRYETCTDCDKMCASIYSAHHWMMIPALANVVPRDITAIIVGNIRR